MDAAETLGQAIEALIAEKSLAKRRTLANTAYAALRTLQGERPPADAGEAEVRGRQKGLLQSLGIAKAAREEHEGIVRKADLGAAYPVLNGLCHYGQSITSTFESLVQKELMESLRKRTPTEPSSS
jgi:hypothetical protein